MIEQAAVAAANGEPILVNAIAVGAGAFVLWMAHAVLQVRDATKAIKIALYGDPDAKERHGGITGDVRKIGDAVDGVANNVTEHIREEMRWRDQNAINVNASNGRHYKMLTRIERKLGLEEEV